MARFSAMFLPERSGFGLNELLAPIAMNLGALKEGHLGPDEIRLLTKRLKFLRVDTPAMGPGAPWRYEPRPPQPSREPTEHRDDNTGQRKWALKEEVSCNQAAKHEAPHRDVDQEGSTANGCLSR